MTTWLSPITVESIVAIIEAAASVTPMVPGNSEDPVHSADCATDASPDGSAHNRADRSGRAPALTGTFLRAADDALRMSEVGYGQQGQCKRGGCQMKL